MNNQLVKYGKYIILLLLIISVFGAGWFIRDLSAQNEISDLIKDRDIKLQEIKTARNKEVSNLANALRSSYADREDLLDQIASLKSKPAEIKYITTVKTVVAGGTTVVSDLPPEHMFRLSNGLPVASFTIADDNKYNFTTADLEFSANVVIGNKDSSVSLQASSSLDENEYELPIKELHVKEIRQDNLFEPHLLLGAAAGATKTKPYAGFFIGSSFIHPGGPFDFASVRAHATSSNIGIGIDPVIYNLGDRLPIFTDLWIGAGPSFDTTGQWSATLTLGSKL